ncbi:MAG: glycosyltransferase family 39 protein [Thermogemmatispora sp.]|uniref:ArnT family glycosyltransferase n=1 Tax=Thermogemmatispora sp. TaxID=1968838 RepID=UPI002624913B|nr:glycosyltransferase family 39 protein [Thermogemmatispora sp.]MBX5456389.1 glycosyltransferase family 39 protein [Thermogemmatispora sp.]
MASSAEATPHTEPVPERRREISWLWRCVLLGGLLLLLLGADAWCYQVALPVEVVSQPGMTSLLVGGQRLPLGHLAPLIGLRLPAQDPALHEYQIDGSDSTNNFTLDLSYIHSISSSWYYRFQSWMRDLEGSSRWRNLQVWSGNHLIQNVAWPAPPTTVSLPGSRTLRLHLELQRPETPRSLILETAAGGMLQITLDRNDRSISLTWLSRELSSQQGTDSAQLTSTFFFPLAAAPFGAEVIDTLVRSLLWATALLLLLMLISSALTSIGSLVGQRLVAVRRPATSRADQEGAGGAGGQKRLWFSASISRTACGQLVPDFLTGWWQRLTTALHPLALFALIASLGYTLWIARVEYNGQPHIYDAAAYVFAAKMYAQGQLAVPLPPTPDLFPGPFMVQFNGRWFAQYPPGTALTLVPGFWLGLPYAVEPILGTLALLGIGLIAARLYDRTVATLAVLLGVLSPFYSYLAASYLSHTITLFYLVWGFWALLRFQQEGKLWGPPLAALCFGLAYLTREQVALLYIAMLSGATLFVAWRRWRPWPNSWLRALIISSLLLLLFFTLDLLYNLALTGNPLITPRELFFPGDRWGFGQGIGFYGAHTLASGLVNLDEQLTILAIDLFGWPFYLTLALPLLPFVSGQSRTADWLLLAGTAAITLAFVGYFYHGIYLGPRYLYETLPFLLMLSARGLVALARNEQTIARSIRQALRRRSASRTGQRQPQQESSTLPQTKAEQEPIVGRSLMGLLAEGCPLTALLFIGLLACNLLYYTPRQISLYQNYSGLPAGTQINLQAIYQPPVHHAIVVTTDLALYDFVLFPLNNPLVEQGDIVYARASEPEEFERLRRAFPGRPLYLLEVGPNGQVTYLPLP